MVKQIITYLIILLGIMSLIGLAIMLLWNELMPDIFGLTKVSFWQALGLGILARLLTHNTEFKKD